MKEPLGAWKTSATTAIVRYAIQRRTRERGRNRESACSWRREIHSTKNISAMKTNGAVPRKIPRGDEKSVPENSICSKNANASEIVGARKKIQPIVTKKNVAKIWQISEIDGNARVSATIAVGGFDFFPSKSLGTKSSPWKIPQTRNVQFAPCQSPQTAKIISVLRIVFALPSREPPSGM